MNAVTIALASDHAGFSYKTRLASLLKDWGHTVVDFGTDSSESCNYPDFVFPAAKAVAAGTADRAIVLGGSGNGEAMCANRVKGVRCAVCWSLDSARLSRQHNDANAMAIGERLVPFGLVEQMVRLWLEEKFDGGRHNIRIDLLDRD